MSLGARRGRRAASALLGGGGGGPFDPVTAISWAASYWAEGSDYTALGLSDGATASSWPDESGALDLNQVVGTAPLHEATGINSEPSVLFGGAGALRDTGWTPIATTWSVVMVAQETDATPSDNYLLDGVGVSNRAIIMKRGASGSATYFEAYAGTAFLQGPAFDTDPHLFVLVNRGSASTTFEVDGSAYTGNIGSHSLAGLTVMNRYTSSNYAEGPVSFVAAYSGDVTADGAWSDFYPWVGSHYGITLA